MKCKKCGKTLSQGDYTLCRNRFGFEPKRGYGCPSCGFDYNPWLPKREKFDNYLIKDWWRNKKLKKWQVELRKL